MPTPTNGDVLVRVTAVGICGSDLHWYAEGSIGDAQLKHPLILGHEFAGVVVDTGQRVAVEPSIPCGVCAECLEGNPNLCETQRFAGHGAQDGALCEYIAWPSNCLFPLPDTLSDVDGAVLEPLGVAIHAVDLGHVKPGMTVGVFGCGPIGLLMLQVARAAGAVQLIATDLLPHRVESARALGAQAFMANDPDHVNQILAATNGRGVDVAFEVSTNSDAVATAIATARPGSRVVLTGIPDDDRTTFKASVARRKGLTLKLVRRMKHTYPRAIRLVESGVVDVRSIVTHRLPLAEADQAFAIANKRDGLKVIVEPTK
jgi:L-iditol 2-dehydrogenase